MGRSRSVLIHAHMFKNAGTTLDWSLARSFGDSFTDHRDNEGMKQGQSYLLPWLEEHVDCRALSSHWITPPLPESAGLEISLCMLFRDPIERMRSVYQFERAQQGVDTPGSRKAKELDFAGYIEWQLQPMPGPAVKNYQTRYCSGDYLSEDLEQSFDKSRRLLFSTRNLGLVHRYDESMALLEYRLRPRFPSLDLSYIRQNSLNMDGAGLAERRAAVLGELGEIADKAQESNEYDIELFALAEQRFDVLLSDVPNLQARLADLRERNARLSVR